MNYTLRKGLNVPTVTVIDEAGRIIEAEQRRVFRHVIQAGHGTDVIFANGTTGEWNRLANAERQRLMAMAMDEVRVVNAELTTEGRTPVEVWLGLNGNTRQEILANLDVAMQLRADAVVIAPLAISDLPESEIVRFFLRDLDDRLASLPQPLPVFLYDNADINAPGRTPHIRTYLIKQLSRLPWVWGIKVSAPRHVLGNYTRAALHFKQPGEFGIYIGHVMLMFDCFRPKHGLLGRLRAGLNEWLLHDALPVGVVSGPGNVMPREWQKAWRASWAGDEERMEHYRRLFAEFEQLWEFAEPGRSQYTGKMIACLKYALELDGVIDSSLVARGTAALTPDQKRIFAERYRALLQRKAEHKSAADDTAMPAKQQPGAAAAISD